MKKLVMICVGGALVGGAVAAMGGGLLTAISLYIGVILMIAAMGARK